VIGIRKLVYVALLAILVASLAIPQAVMAEEKVSIIGTYKLTELSSYLYDTANNKLEALNASLAKIQDYEMTDLESSDSYVPAIVINLSAQSLDVNTNETITYAYVFTKLYGSVAIGTAEISNNTLSNATFIKITGTGEDLAVYRTGLGIEVAYGDMKYVLPQGSVIVYTDENMAVNSVMEIELRALMDVPSGYVLVRNGNSEAEFTVQATGVVSIWFDEEHSGGDVDLFVFDSSNPNYASASPSQSWTWLLTHSDAYIFSDLGPDTEVVSASGTLKFIVKTYTGSPPSWRIALQASTPSTTPTPTSTPSQITPTPTPEEEGWLDQLQSVFEGSNTVIIAIAIVLFLVIVLIALRK